jgi:predicted acylesterase/phospholipase RssA
VKGSLVSGFHFARYAAGLRAVVEALWLNAFALLTAILVNVLIPATSQGRELVDSLADASGGAIRVATLLASAAYCAAACGMSAALVLRLGRFRPTKRASVLRARRAVPYWLAAAVGLSSSAIVVPLSLVSAGVPFVLLASLLALPFVGEARVLSSPLKVRTVAIAVPCLAILGACVGAAIVAFPVTAARALGAWPIVYVASGFWTIVASVVFVALPKRLNLPAMLFLPVALFLIFSRTNDNHVIRRLADVSRASTSGSASALGPRFDAWLRATCVPSPKPCPVYLAAAQGGGTRSAYWTASILQALDTHSEGRFSRHLFAISGVSGGALGAAAFVAAKADAAADPHLDRASRLRAFIGDDYLSPIVGSLLFPDFMARFVPFPLPQFDRATAFELALERSWRAAFGSDRFAHDLNDLYAGAGGAALPSLLLTATNVETGKRFVVSNLAFDPSERGDAYYANDSAAAYGEASMTLSTAVHLGARFPYISPHGVLDVAGSAVPWGRLVDGGYYDNSGAATLADLLDALERHVRATAAPRAPIRPEFIVIAIASDVDTMTNDNSDRAFASRPQPRVPPSAMMHVYHRADTVPEDSLTFSELDSPVEALLSAREAHAEAELRHLAQRVEAFAAEDGLRCDMARAGMRATCAPSPVFEEYSYARALASQDFEGLTNAMSHGRADRHAIVQLIRPGLGWTLSPRSRRALDELSVLAVERQQIR